MEYGKKSVPLLSEMRERPHHGKGKPLSTHNAKNLNNMARSINTRETSIVTRNEMVKKLLADLHDGKHAPMTEDEEQTAFADRNTPRGDNSA